MVTAVANMVSGGESMVVVRPTIPTIPNTHNTHYTHNMVSGGESVVVVRPTGRRSIFESTEN